MNLSTNLAQKLDELSDEQKFDVCALTKVFSDLAKTLPEESDDRIVLIEAYRLIDMMYHHQSRAISELLEDTQIFLATGLIYGTNNTLLLAAAFHAEWLKDKNYKACSSAIEQYIEAASIIEEKQLGKFCHLNTKKHLRAAAELAKSTNNPLKNDIQSLAFLLLEKNLELNGSFFQLWMIEIIRLISSEKNSALIPIIKKIIDAEIAHGSSPRNVKFYHNALIELLTRDADKTAALEEKNKVANYYLSYTKKVIEIDINQLRGHWALVDEYLVDAKTIYAELNDQPAVKECKDLIAQAQQHFRENMQRISVNIPAQDMASAADSLQKALDDRELEVHLSAFVAADLFKFRLIEEYKNESDNINSDSITHALNFQTALYEADKVADVTDARTSNLNWHLNLTYSLKYVSLQRYKGLLQEKFGDEEISAALEYIACKSPLIPQEYHAQVFKALYYGWFDEDGIISTSIIGPIFEHCLREIVKNEGEYSLKGKRGETIAQNDLTLEDLCRDHRTTITASKLINKEAFENLEYLLIKPGFKLRHRSAHGLLNDKDYIQPLHKIIWLLFLQLALYPLAEKK